MHRLHVIAIVVAGVLLLLGSTPAGPPSVDAQQSEQVPLVPGCNNVALTWSGGTPLATVAAAVSPASALESIFRYDAQLRRFVGYAPAAPANVNDYRSVGASFEAAFICMRAAGRLARPTGTAAPVTSQPPPARVTPEDAIARWADEQGREAPYLGDCANVQVPRDYRRSCSTYEAQRCGIRAYRLGIVGTDAALWLFLAEDARGWAVIAQGFFPPLDSDEDFRIPPWHNVPAERLSC